ncbi:hypothetical protein AB1K54_10775 [Microbacterium sp. BWT-B31]|uniref:hypothetical protein n=1 Tax=Microbacterium sp. BWT-B31 TaxID=3232072 RepID=UPI003528B9C3
MSTVEPTPRTDAEPMAFTKDEFLLGTLASWLAFNLVFDTVLTGAAIATFNPLWGPLGASIVALVVYAVPIALVVSGIVALLLCSAAWWLGRLLRRVRSLLVHAVAYATLGTAIGVLVVGSFQLVVAGSLNLGNWLAQITLVGSAAALPLGWGWSVWRCRRIEAGKARAPRRGIDESFEDSL